MDRRSEVSGGVFSEPLMVFKILHGFFVRLCRASTGKCAKIFPLSGFGILLSRIQAELAGFKLSNHRINRSVSQLRLRRVRLAWTAEL